MANTYSDTNGTRYNTSQIDRKIKEAKQQKLNDSEYPHCETCKRSTGVRIDMSHLVSVKWAKENSCCELAWDVNNIILECRDCHNLTENQSSDIRYDRYLQNK